MPETKEIELMRKYIKKTGISSSVNYDIRANEMRALWPLFCKDFWNAFSLLYNYGQAKGYRMAKAEMKKGII